MKAYEQVTIDVNIEKFRYSLVGDGYLLEEVKPMTHEELIDILCRRITNHIETEYDHGKRLELY